jgi:hypothetical protein
MKILLPTKMNKKPANRKLEKLKIFLFAFSKLIPSKVSQKPKQTKIKGNNLFGSDLLVIMFIESIGNNSPKLKLII